MHATFGKRCGLIAMLLVLVCGAAEGRESAPYNSLEYDIDRADMIVLGTVTRVFKVLGTRIAEVRIDETLAGDVEGSILVCCNVPPFGEPRSEPRFLLFLAKERGRYGIRETFGFKEALEKAAPGREIFETAGEALDRNLDGVSFRSWVKPEVEVRYAIPDLPRNPDSDGPVPQLRIVNYEIALEALRPYIKARRKNGRLWPVPASSDEKSLTCDGPFAKGLDPFAAKWFKQELERFDEPEMCGAGAPEEYRLLWIPSFHAPAVFRFVVNGDGTATVVSKTLRGKRVKTKSVSIGQEEVEKFRRQFAEASFFDLPTSLFEMGLDGTTWVLEARIGDRYRLVERWEPLEGDFRRTCEMLGALSELGVGPAEKDDGKSR